jgi:hypothetical protein
LLLSVDVRDPLAEMDRVSLKAPVSNADRPPVSGDVELLSCYSYNGFIHLPHNFAEVLLHHEGLGVDEVNNRIPPAMGNGRGRPPCLHMGDVVEVDP